jgi:hypothetical protein
VNECFTVSGRLNACQAFCEILGRAHVLHRATLNGDLTLHEEGYRMPAQGYSTRSDLKEITGSLNMWFLENFSVADEKTHKIDHWAINTYPRELEKSLLGLMNGAAFIRHIGFRFAGRKSPEDFKFVLRAATQLLKSEYYGAIDIMAETTGDMREVIDFELKHRNSIPRLAIRYDPATTENGPFIEELIENLKNDKRFESVAPK